MISQEVMNMKRFLLLFVLIVFVIMGCAGPSKVRWTKPDFDQDQFEKDRKGCLQAVNADSEKKMTTEECLAKKGYESEPELPSDKEKANTAETMKTVGKVLLAIGVVVVGVPIILLPLL
jgi:hypothetical protein